MIEFRDLKQDEIDCRVQSCGRIKKDGDILWARVLLYKDARVDQNILDETVGNDNWQRSHKEVKGNLYCSVGINVNYKQSNFDTKGKEPNWVWKEDCGTESNTEKEKGEASDSFKRACVNWGIGRELYTKIPIMIFGLPRKENKNEEKNEVDGTFIVEKIKIENKEIVALSLIFKSNKTKDAIRCFVWTKEEGVLKSNYLQTTTGISFKGE